MDDIIENEAFKTEYRSVWEEEQIKIMPNYKMDRFEEEYTCKHVKNRTIPIVIVATNEGGYNSTGVCGECIVEIVTKHLSK